MPSQTNSSREHGHGRVADIGEEERPRVADDRVGLVDADVAAPTTAPPSTERGRHPGGLRVVQDDDVVLANALGESRQVPGHDVLVEPARVLVERPAVARRPVQVVVEPAWSARRTPVARRLPPSGRRLRRRGRNRGAGRAARRRRPRAVEFTFQTTRPASSSRACSIASWNCSKRSGERTVPNWFGSLTGSLDFLGRRHSSRPPCTQYPRYARAAEPDDASACSRMPTCHGRGRVRRTGGAVDDSTATGRKGRGEIPPHSGL